MIKKEIKTFILRVIIIFLISFLIFLFLYYIYKGLLDIYSIVISILLGIFISIYKYLLEIIILNNSNNIKIINNILFKLDKILLKKNKWLIKPIYYFLYYFPTNWPFLIILWVARKWWDIRLFINSNKDVLLFKYKKKYFNNWNIFYKSWIKKYIINIFLRIIFVPLFLKLTLLTRSWTAFFFFRIFGIIYSTVLLINNLNVFFWFKNTNYLNFHMKLLICFLIIYIFLFYFPTIVERVYGLKWKEDMKILNYNNGVNFYWIFFIKLLNNDTIFSSYYNNYKYLLFFQLNNWYYSYICIYYNKYFFKDFKSNIYYPTYFIKLGKFDCSNVTFKDIFKDNNLIRKVESVYDIIWMYEKNYKYSFFLYGNIIFLNKIMYIKFIKLYNNYGLLKILFGDKIVDDYFKEEILEFENLILILLIWFKLYSFQVYDNYIIPLNYSSNYNYNYILKLSNFLHYYNINILYYLNIEFNLQDNSTIQIIMKDSYNEYRNFKSRNDLLNYYEKCDLNLDDKYVQLRLAIFDNNIYKNSYNSYNNIKLESNKYNNINDNLIYDLQNKHLKKYSNVKNKSSLFFENVNMKDEWKIFDNKK